MSFTIKLQQNSSEKNRVGKSVSDLVTMTGTLKNQTSIINPTIIIEGNVSTYALANYMTIPVFGRSYFITDIKSIQQDVFEVSGHVDVLDSFEASIKGCVGIVRKQENVWNLYLNDGTFKVYQNSMVVTKKFPSGFDRYKYILAVAGA